MTVSIVQDYARIPQVVSIDRWRAILAERNRYSFFQTPEWSALMQASFPEWRPMHSWFRFSDGQEAILPLFAIPKRWGIAKLESLPWGAYGDLLGTKSFTMEHRKAAIEQILSPLKPICALTIHPSFSQDLPDTHPIPFGIEMQAKSTLILELGKSFDEVWSNQFQARNRTAIRRAQERGVQISHSNNAESISAMKSLYENAVRRWKGVETIPPTFFDALLNWPDDQIRIWLASHRGRVIAGDVLLYGRRETQYFTGASDPDFSDLNGSKYLMSEIIRDACERGYQTFNFGASGGLQGVEQFKKLFGGEAVEYTRIRFTYPGIRAVHGVVKRWIRIRK